MGIKVIDTLAIKPSHKGGEWQLTASPKQYGILHFDSAGKQTGGTYWSRRHGGKDISEWAFRQAIQAWNNKPAVIGATHEVFNLEAWQTAFQSKAIN